MGVLFEAKAAIEPDYMRKKKAAERKAGKKLTNEEFEAKYLEIGGGGRLSDTGTSIFDPVLCETQYLWFSNKGDAVIDPFCGGSVRGIVAVELGRRYTGIDLRQEQIDANIAGSEICTGEKPAYICGDSREIDTIASGEYDFLFTCPPYGNLEVYSDDPLDLSNMSAEEFDDAYTDILQKASNMLKDNRFATIVVGNYRDKKGFMRDLCGITIRAMEAAGLKYYNDMIFVTPCGSLPIRAGKSFSATRKVGKTHQYILNFVKGDPKKAAQRLEAVEIPDLDGYMTEEE